MTVVAAFAISGYPVVFGDLLLTGPSGSEGQTVAVPTQGEVQEFFGDSGWSVIGLNQKVTLLADNCVVAWAGSWLGARVAIARLRKLAKADYLTCESILKYLNADSDLSKHPTSFVGMVTEPGGIRQFRFNAEHFNSATLGNVFLSGTGSAAIREFSDLLASMETQSTGSMNVADNCVAKTMMLGGLLLQAEFRSGLAAATLRNMFGGGYEIAFHSNGRIQKLAEASYVFWTAEVAPDGVRVSSPQLVVKQRYLGDYLFIRSARVEAAAEQLRLVDEQRHIISPMYEAPLDIAQEKLKAISLQSNLLCHCILVLQSGKQTGIYTRVQRYSPNSEVTITFEDKDDQVVFGFRGDTMAQIAQSLERFKSGSSG